MKIKDIALSAAAIGERVVKAIAIGAVEVWSAVKYIVFNDKVVEQICATNWGDGVGITEEQAAAVTALGTIFKGNKEITSFDELEEFIGVTKLNSNDTEANAPFMGCTSLASVKIPQSVTEIGERSFSGCTSLTKVGSLENVKKLGRWAFANTLLGGELSMSNLTVAKAYAFQNTLLKKVVNLGSITRTDQTFAACSQLEECYIPNSCKAIGGRTFYDCAKLKKVYGMEGCTSIESSAFYGCTDFKESISVPYLTSMDGEAFRLSGITSVDNLGSIPAIGTRTFMQCENLRKVVLPASITSIGIAAFYGTSSLDALVINAVTPPTLADSGVFQNSKIAKGGGYIYVPDQSVTAYRGASVWSSYADQIKPLSQYVES